MATVENLERGVFESLRSLEAVWRETDLLAEFVGRELGANGFKIVDDEGIPDSDDSQWLYMQYMWQFSWQRTSTSKRGRQRTRRIALQANVSRPGEGVPVAGPRPTLDVLHSPNEGWTLDRFVLPQAAEQFTQETEFLWVQGGHTETPWEDRVFAYSLPLLKLTDSKSVIDNVVTPLAKLLIHNLDPSTAFIQAHLPLRFRLSEGEVLLK